MEDANKLYETMKEFLTEQIQDCTEKNNTTESS